MPNSSILLLKSLSLLSSLQPPSPNHRHHLSFIMSPSQSSQQFLHHHSPSPQPKKIQSFTTSCIEVLQKSNLSVDNDDDLDIDNHGGCRFYNYMKLCNPALSDVVVSGVAICQNRAEIEARLCNGIGNDLWMRVRDEAKLDVQEEPILGNYYYKLVLNHQSLSSALANLLAMKLSNSSLSIGTLYDLLLGVLVEDKEIVSAVEDDLRAVKERDPACVSYVHCLLNFKGFHACQAHRVAHKLWSQGKKVLALVIQSRVSEVFAVDIHPGARIGRRILIDHATGLVVGETAVIGDDVSILHNVTLGGTGKSSGDRHPKIGDGVLIGAGTCVLGNVRIGNGAKIGAGSVVLKDIPPRTTAVGNPARLIGGKENPVKLDKIPSLTMDQTSHISEWSDYVI